MAVDYKQPYFQEYLKKTPVSQPAKVKGTVTSINGKPVSGGFKYPTNTIDDTAPDWIKALFTPEAVQQRQAAYDNNPSVRKVVDANVAKQAVVKAQQPVTVSAPQTAMSAAQPVYSPPATFTPPAFTGINFADAVKQSSQQLDPLFLRALENIKSQRYQDSLNAGQTAVGHGGAHSGLGADLQNKVAIAASGKMADADAQRQSQVAEMAQALVNRDQDRADRLRAEAFQEYMGQQNLGLQKANADRSYGLDLAGLTGDINGQQTLAAKGQNFNQNLAQNQFNAQQQNQQFNQNLQTQQFNANEAQRAWDNAFQQGQFNQQKAQQLWENTFKEKSFDQDVKQFAAQLGYNYDQLGQSQKQFVAEQAYKAKALQLQQDQFNYQSDPNNPDNLYKQAQIEHLNQPPATAAELPKYADVVKDIDSSRFIGKDELGGVTVTDPTGLEAYILSKPGLTVDQLKQLYTRYNLPMK